MLLFVSCTPLGVFSSVTSPDLVVLNVGDHFLATVKPCERFFAVEKETLTTLWSKFHLPLKQSDLFKTISFF